MTAEMLDFFGKVCYTMKVFVSIRNIRSVKEHGNL